MIGQTIGRYRILEKLGEGGMGAVWRAEDPVLGRHAAIKLLPERTADSPEARGRFLREGRAACALHHPGIATVYEAGEDSGRVYIAFEIVEGGTVADRLAQGPLPVPEALRIAREAALALGHAHDKGILHRDVTSRNLMLDGEGKVKVVDFGLALPEGETRITSSGSTLGTMGYLAPETARGETADRRADLYGLGVVLYEMLTGKLPFQASRAEAVLYAVVHEPPPAPSTKRPDLPPDLDRLLLHLLDKDPRKRPPDAASLVAALRRLERGEALPGGAPRSTHPLRRTLPVAGVAALAVVVAFVLLRDPWGFRTPAVHYSSVAVLPLEVAPGSAAEGTLWAEGISETMAQKLAGLPEVRVTPWVSSRGFSTRMMPAADICTELNVEAIVTGTFRISVRDVEGTVALRSADGSTLWTTEFREPFSDILHVQGEIALSVAQQLKGRLSRNETGKLEENVSASLEAYEAYLRGSRKVHEQTHAAAREALAFFNRALVLDPALAPAHVGIGSVHMDYYFFGWEGGFENLRIADGSFRKALELDPGNARALRGLVRSNWQAGRYLQDLELARDMSRNGAESIEEILVCAEGYCFGGLPSLSIPLFRRAMQLDPVNVGACFHLVHALVWCGEFEEAVRAADEYFQRFPEDPEVHIWAGIAQENLGHPEIARLHYGRGTEISPVEMIRAAAALSFLDVKEGKTGAAMLQPDLLDEQRARLALYPDNFSQGIIIVSLLAAARDPEVREEADRLVEASGANPRILSEVATSLALAGEHERAAEIFRMQLEAGVPDESSLYVKEGLVGNGGLFDRPEYAALREDWIAGLERLRKEYAP